MTTTEVKTSDLSGEALNWAVGLAEGLDVFVESGQHGNDPRVFVRRQYTVTGSVERYDPANDWATGGPLIDKHRICLDISQGKWDALADEWVRGAESALVAACRAIVSAKLGETVSVPAELMPCA